MKCVFRFLFVMFLCMTIPSCSGDEPSSGITIDVTQGEDGSLQGNGLVFKITSFTDKTFSVGGTTQEIDQNTFEGPLVIPSKIKYDGKVYSLISIGKDVFKNFYRLKSVVIPNGCERIGRSAFEGCGSLKEISLPSSCKILGWYAFSDCRSLKTVVIPNGCEEIGEDAFRLCENLEEISLPSSCKILGSSAFYGCTGLKTIIVYSEELKPEDLYHALGFYWLGDLYNNVHIYVPKNLLGKYLECFNNPRYSIEILDLSELN